MTTSKQHQIVIENWMTTTLRNGGVQRDGDLHIDQIDPQWRKKEYWLRAGLEVFGIALHLRNVHKLDRTVVLAFSLVGSQQRSGADFTKSAELEAELDWSPPSLYLFDPRDEPWN